MKRQQIFYDEPEDDLLLVLSIHNLKRLLFYAFIFGLILILAMAFVNISGLAP
jgi:hypothetical protein